MADLANARLGGSGGWGSRLIGFWVYRAVWGVCVHRACRYVGFCRVCRVYGVWGLGFRL